MSVHVECKFFNFNCLAIREARDLEGCRGLANVIVSHFCDNVDVGKVHVSQSHLSCSFKRVTNLCAYIEIKYCILKKK